MQENLSVIMTVIKEMINRAWIKIWTETTTIYVSLFLFLKDKRDVHIHVMSILKFGCTGFHLPTEFLFIYLFYFCKILSGYCQSNDK